MSLNFFSRFSLTGLTMVRRISEVAKAYLFFFIMSQFIFGFAALFGFFHDALLITLTAIALVASLWLCTDLSTPC